MQSFLTMKERQLLVMLMLLVFSASLSHLPLPRVSTQLLPSLEGLTALMELCNFWTDKMLQRAGWNSVSVVFGRLSVP